MANMDNAYGITTTQITIGATTVVGITAGVYCNGYIVNLLSGGTVAILGVSTASIIGYPLGTVPVMIGGPIAFYLQESAGVTSKVAIVKTLTQGFGG